MLSPDQLKELALFNGFQAMQAQLLAAQASQAAEQMSAQLKELQSQLRPSAVPEPVESTKLSGGILARAQSDLQHAVVDQLR